MHRYVAVEVSVHIQPHLAHLFHVLRIYRAIAYLLHSYFSFGDLLSASL